MTSMISSMIIQTAAQNRSGVATRTTLTASLTILMIVTTKNGALKNRTADPTTQTAVIGNLIVMTQTTLTANLTTLTRTQIRSGAVIPTTLTVNLKIPIRRE